MHSFADYSLNQLPNDDVREMTALLTQNMEADTIKAKNSKGNTFMHMACHRGNLLFVKTVLYEIWYRFPLDTDFVKDLLNTPNNDGDFVWDCCHEDQESC